MTGVKAKNGIYHMKYYNDGRGGLASNSKMYLKRFINIYNSQLDTSYAEQKVAHIVMRRFHKRGEDLPLLTTLH
jgi:hypothetical protein